MRNLPCPDEHGIFPPGTEHLVCADYCVRGNIGLIDADLLDGGTRHPNLVIMKLSAFFKEKGCRVHLIENYEELKGNGEYRNVNRYDAIFVSKVFDYTYIDPVLLKYDNVYFGGTGFFFDHAIPLPDEIEHHMPDYHVYDDFIAHDTKHLRQKNYWLDYQDYSIGFATRGCFRQCEFCVNHCLTKVLFHSHVEEWLDRDRKYIYLWDDNIFGYPYWRQVFEELEATGKRYRFRQGLDIRLLTPEKAKVLSEAHYYRDVVFAFDNIEEADIIEKKLALWREYSDRGTQLYVLAGFAGQDEKEIISVFERIKILIKYGCVPYIMRHELYNQSPYKGMFIQIARWCNQPQFFKKMSFRQYIHYCQSIHKTDRPCSPMRVMTAFEQQFPMIAKEYFDMEYLKQPYVIKRTEQKRKS